MIISKRLLSLLLAGSMGITACNAENPVKAAGDGAVASKDATPQKPRTMDHGAMSLGPRDQSFDLRFIDGMTPHHEGAVEMSRQALKLSKRPEILTLAQAIIDAQAKEIAQMKVWRQSWYPDVSPELVMWHEEMKHMMAMTPEMRQGMMMSGDLGLADDQFDQRFIDAMIPHHEGALVMAQDALEKSDRPPIRQMAEAILQSQTEEINQMKQWRKSWYDR
jgi:uncharacterized protein (DUF305 family)